MIEISLSPSEMFLGALTGVKRHIQAIVQGRPDCHGIAKVDGWRAHCEGACGEIAVANALGVYWGGTVGTFKVGGDLAERIQVRTRSKHEYELIVREGDRDEDVFVLVTGVSPEFRVHGFLLGGEAKREEWLVGHGGRPPAYFVPHNSLHPIHQLKDAAAMGIV